MDAQLESDIKKLAKNYSDRIIAKDTAEAIIIIGDEIDTARTVLRGLSPKAEEVFNAEYEELMIKTMVFPFVRDH